MALTGPAKLTIAGIVIGGGITGSALISLLNLLNIPLIFKNY